ncbi:hypothetical protein [Kibdelosporangium phytohabitans]|uniref:hypothetical protein n=1 Tax=Kibdelosporangium phytohabitans TaxID=860235 RepID=UPI0007C7352F|nr:hypothetical protein [Kibdelosporangium phytohabitans]MBE1465679.1 hypothetical protein [Kibdelosporangium phytohabitans]
MHPIDNEAGAHAQLARDFEDHLREGYRYLVKAINYRAKAFNEMLTMYGGVRTAQLLLQGPRTSEGFARLWEENMLQHSVEASVLRPKYRSLFTDTEQDAARRRLEDHQFDVEGFLRHDG